MHKVACCQWRLMIKTGYRQYLHIGMLTIEFIH